MGLSICHQELSVVNHNYRLIRNFSRLTRNDEVKYGFVRTSNNQTYDIQFCNYQSEAASTEVTDLIWSDLWPNFGNINTG